MIVKPISVETLSATVGETIYPVPFDSAVSGRSKIKLGNLFDLSNFGVNLTKIEPGSASALYHFHSHQDEFIYILEGEPTLKIGSKEYLMKPGECVGFKAGTGVAHQLINNSNENVTYLEVGDRSPNDNVEYPNDDIQAALSAEGSWVFSRKDGSPFC